VNGCWAFPGSPGSGHRSFHPVRFSSRSTCPRSTRRFHDRGLHRRCRPHAHGQAGRWAVPGASRRHGGTRDQGGPGAQRRGPHGRRGRGVRMRGHPRSPGGRHRTHGVAGCRPAGGDPGYDHRPPVRLRAAGRELRSDGHHVRPAGPGGGRRRAEHEHDPPRPIPSQGPPAGWSAMEPRRFRSSGVPS
jgi:hypothetical protein